MDGFDEMLAYDERMAQLYIGLDALTQVVRGTIDSDRDSARLDAFLGVELILL